MLPARRSSDLRNADLSNPRVKNFVFVENWCSSCAFAGVPWVAGGSSIFIQPHKTPDSRLEMERPPGGLNQV